MAGEIGQKHNILRDTVLVEERAIRYVVLLPPFQNHTSLITIRIPMPQAIVMLRFDV